MLVMTLIKPSRARPSSSSARGFLSRARAEISFEPKIRAQARKKPRATSRVIFLSSPLSPNKYLHIIF